MFFSHRKFKGFIALSIATSAAFVPGSALAEIDNSLGEDQGISVSMTIDESVEVGDEISINELDLTTKQRADIRAQRVPTSSAAVEPFAAGPYDVIASWKDKEKKNVILRRQAYDKIVSKHNLTTAVVKKVTKDYTWKGRAGATSTKYNYNLKFGRFICYPNRCILKEEVMVLTVVDFRSLGQGKLTYGVVTTYCETGKPRCPDFVKKAYNL